MFHLAQPEQAVAWQQFVDPAAFHAPYGITTAEQRHPKFRSHGTGKCEWDGAVWPFATSQTLTGLANLLRGPEQTYVTKRDYFDALLTYARSQRQDGEPYIGEYLDEKTGQWLITGPKAQRSRDYNHSTFNDLVITGLAGLVPRDDDTVEVDPLLPDSTWDWFCLDGIPYHGRRVDRVGSYRRTLRPRNRLGGFRRWQRNHPVTSTATVNRQAARRVIECPRAQRDCDARQPDNSLLFISR